MPDANTVAAVDPLDAAIPTTQEPPQAAVPAKATAQAVGTPIKRVLPEYETVSIEDEGAAARTQLDFYKGQKNVTDRMGILDLKRIATARSHFDDTVKSVICRSKFARTETKGPDGKTLYSETIVEKAGCCERLGEARKRFAVPIIQYVTNQKGEFVRPVNFQLKVWIFSAGIFSTLQDINKEHPLATHDVKVKCTEPQYQKMEIVPAAESMVANAKFQELHGAGLRAWLDAIQSELRRAIGRDMSDEEIDKQLGNPAQTVAAGAGPVPGADLDKLLQ